MARYYGRFECEHIGCSEVANYSYSTRAEQTESYKRHHKTPWRCVRHSQPHEVLSESNPVRISEIVSKRLFTESGADIGLYFGKFGFMSGLGFKVFAKDFPEGTKLRVTAEIIMPTEDRAPREKIE